MTSNGWEWPVTPSGQQHEERIPLMREIAYEAMHVVGEEEVLHQGATVARTGKALSLNISSGGMLLLMEVAPEPSQMLRVQVPTPVAHANTPTLAEVAWARQVPVADHHRLHFVGVKFLL